jgi:hypothetical protein
MRLYTPETPVYDNEGFVGWDNDDYRIVPESGKGARTWFDRSPLALSPGIYVIEPLGDKYDENDVVEPSGDKYDEKVRVSIKPGRVTEVWFASYRIEASGSGIKLEDREIFKA